MSRRTLSLLAACSLFVASCGGEETEAADEITTTEAAAEETVEETDTAAEPEAAEQDTTTEDETAEDDTAAEAAEDETEGEPAEDDQAEGAVEDADDEDSSTTDADASAAPSVSITAVSFSANTITISNNGDTALDLDGYYLCNRPSYAALPATILEPGATMDLDGSVIEIQGDGGEVGLYSSEQFDSASDLVAYVQWGNPDNGRASVAVAGGLIVDGEYIENGGEDFTTE